MQKNIFYKNFFIGLLKFKKKTLLMFFPYQWSLHLRLQVSYRKLSLTATVCKRMQTLNFIYYAQNNYPKIK